MNYYVALSNQTAGQPYRYRGMLAGARRLLIAVLLITTSLGSSSVAVAGALYQEVSDQVLEEIRGKFVSASSIQYFGLSMTTYWLSPDATPYQVELALSLDTTDPDNPTMTIQVGGTLGQSVATIDTPPIGAPEQVGGAVQVISVSGNGNLVENNLNISVIPATDYVAPTQSDQLAAAGQTFQNGDGTITQFTSGQTLGYTVITQQNDRVVQTLGNNVALGQRQLIQAVDLTGNSHHIVNSIRMSLAVDNTDVLRRSVAGFSQSLMLGIL